MDALLLGLVAEDGMEINTTITAQFLDLLAGNSPGVDGDGDSSGNAVKNCCLRFEYLVFDVGERDAALAVVAEVVGPGDAHSHRGIVPDSVSIGIDLAGSDEQRHAAAAEGQGQLEGSLRDADRALSSGERPGSAAPSYTP